MFHLVGSGKFVTAPIITEDGYPILDPIVVQQTRLDEGNELPQHCTPTNTGGIVDRSIDPLSDNKEIQWKLTLHQIGEFITHNDLCHQPCRQHT